MKRFLSMILVVSLFFSLTACVKKSDDTDFDETASLVQPSGDEKPEQEQQPSQNEEPEQNDKAPSDQTPPQTDEPDDSQQREEDPTPEPSLPEPTEPSAGQQSSQQPEPPEADVSPQPDVQEPDLQEPDVQDSVDSLTGVDKLRVDYNYGACRQLKGDVSVVLFFMNDSESSWTEAEINKFTETEIKPGLDFLEKQAKIYNVDLNLTIKASYSSINYTNDVIVDINSAGECTIDVLRQAAIARGYTDDTELIEELKKEYGTEVICYTVFNKEGTPYALNPPRDDDTKVEEHCIIFVRDIGAGWLYPQGAQSSMIAHVTLNLFGAENYYSTPERKALAKIHYPSDIMLAANYFILTNNIGDATAFYIGWTDNVPDILNNENW